MGSKLRYLLAGLAVIGSAGFATLPLAQPASAGPAGPTASMVASGIPNEYVLTYTFASTVSTPALLALDVPGLDFSAAGFNLTSCTHPGGSCTGETGLGVSKWGGPAGGPSPIVGSNVVLNLVAGGAPNYTGTFNPGDTITIDITNVANPSNDSASYPVVVSAESSPGVVIETADTTVAATGTTATVPQAASVAVTVTPNSAGASVTTWGVDITSLVNPAALTDNYVDLYMPGAAFPVAAGDYSATCQTCGSVTVTPVTTASNGLAGTGVRLQITPSSSGATDVNLSISGVTNPNGAGGTTQALLVDQETAAGAVEAVANSTPVSFVASPFVGFTSSNVPSFPASIATNSATPVGLNVSNTTDYSYPNAGLVLSLAGIANISPSDVSLTCTPEGTTSTFSVSFAQSGANSLQSTSLPLSLTSISSVQFDCRLLLAYGTSVGNMSVDAKLYSGATLIGENSASISVTQGTPPPPPAPPAAAPTSVNATAQGLTDSATVSWTDSDPSVASYTVTPSDVTTGATGTAQTVNAPIESVLVSGLKAGDEYTFAVTASNTTGTSAAVISNPVTILGVTGFRSSSSPSTLPSSGSESTATVPVGAYTLGATATGPAGGSGTVTVSSYNSDPVPGLVSGGTYFDVTVSPGSSFTQVTFDLCGVPAGASVSWWNPQTRVFEKVSDQSGPTGSGSCVTVTVGPATSPSLSELQGTVFALSTAGSTASTGYRITDSHGQVTGFGGAGTFGSASSLQLDAPIVGSVSTPDGKGYWLVGADGGVFAFGDAGFYGSTGGMTLARPVVGMASTPDGKGYWLVGADGGVFAFGDAGFYGSTGGMTLARPVVGIAADPSGRGYWLAASDGGVFAFGAAQFAGSAAGSGSAMPVVSISSGS